MTSYLQSPRLPAAIASTSAGTDLMPRRLLTVAFYMLAFFVIIGTTPPFQPQVLDDGDLDFVKETGSNAINQMFLSIVYLLSLPAVYHLRKELTQTLRGEKWLTIFVLWCGVTTIWSDDPVVTLKRWVQLVGGLLVCFCYVQYHSGLIRQMRPFLPILGFFVVSSFVSVFAIGAAIDMKVTPPGWRGIAESKNVLGQFSAYAAILFGLAYRKSIGWSRIGFALLVLLAIILLAGSRSTTSLMAFVAAAGVATLSVVRRHLDRVGVGTVFVALVVATGIACFVSILLIDPSLFGNSLETMGKDATFTGRTPLWNMVIEEANRHPITGFGFGAFWLESNPRVFVIGHQIGWAAPHAHQGFLDIMNETGYTGLAMMLWLLIVYFRGVLRGRGDPAWSYFIIAAVVLNLQESQLFRTNTLSTVLFSLAYFSQFADARQSLGAVHTR
jgi:exopolysaccharide production protein ExoQ